MSESPVHPPGTTYRFVVNSAEEAVRMIQAKLGPSARVISVKQTGRQGFAGLLRSPQLEVIAEVTAEPVSSSAALPSPPAAAPSAPVVAALPPAPVEDESTWLQPEPAAAPSADPRLGEKGEMHPLERLLSRTGLTGQTLARLQQTPQWPAMLVRPIAESLGRVVDLLREQWMEQSQTPTGARVAFFGPPGSGSTTALCKALTMDVFFRQQAPTVMKLDGDQPNPTEGLAMFCEALNVPLLSSADAPEHHAENGRFYFDTCGCSLRDAPAWRDLGRLFGEFYIDTRVLVLNAAYEPELLKRAYQLGQEAGATHVVFTHLDEVHHWGKLWEPLLGGGLTPLFFSCGQNVSGDLAESTFDLLVEKTFGLRK